MSDNLEELRSENEALNEKVVSLTNTVKGYEKIIQLNEEEITNLEKLVNMYDSIVEFNRRELIDAHESIKASEFVRELSSDELKKSLGLIDELEKLIKTARRKKEETNRQINSEN